MKSEEEIKKLMISKSREGMDVLFDGFRDAVLAIDGTMGDQIAKKAGFPRDAVRDINQTIAQELVQKIEAMRSTSHRSIHKYHAAAPDEKQESSKPAD